MTGRRPIRRPALHSLTRSSHAGNKELRGKETTTLFMLPLSENTMLEGTLCQTQTRQTKWEITPTTEMQEVQHEVISPKTRRTPPHTPHRAKPAAHTTCRTQSSVNAEHIRITLQTIRTGTQRRPLTQLRSGLAIYVYLHVRIHDKEGLIKGITDKATTSQISRANPLWATIKFTEQAWAQKENQVRPELHCGVVTGS